MTTNKSRSNKYIAKAKQEKTSVKKDAKQGKSKVASKAKVVTTALPETEEIKVTNRSINIGMPVGEEELKELKEKAKEL